MSTLAMVASQFTTTLSMMDLRAPQTTTQARHPWLDVLVKTGTHLIGIEAKRYEPFRTKEKKKEALSKAYFGDCWGSAMRGYERIRDSVRDANQPWLRLDAEQLFKHAFALRTAIHDTNSNFFKMQPILYYVYAEPKSWPKAPQRNVDRSRIEKHRDELAEFAKIVSHDEVLFRSCTYRELLTLWRTHRSEQIRKHAEAVTLFFKDNF